MVFLSILGTAVNLMIKYDKIQQVPCCKDIDVQDITSYADMLIMLSDDIIMSAETDAELTARPEDLDFLLDKEITEHDDEVAIAAL